MSRVVIAYYSSYGHTFEMAKAVAEGVKEAGSEPLLRRVPELDDARAAMSSQPPYVEAQEAQKDIAEVTHDDLRQADGIIFGTPTRFGNMAAQLKQFLDTMGGLWMNGELEDKAGAVFTSTANTHGGMESTILTTMVPMLHFGLVLVGSPYSQNEQLTTSEGRGGSPYGPGTIAGADGSRMPTEEELQMCRNLGRRVSLVAEALRSMKQAKQQGISQPDKKDRAA